MKKFSTTSGESPVLHRNSANLMQSMLDEVKASIIVLPELQALIPALQMAEYNQLEANIRKDGCREAIIVWQTTQGLVEGSSSTIPVNVLVDGHNRYAICTTHKIDFRVSLREFESLEVVRDFMIDNQLGRRNLTPEQTSYLRGLKYRNERHSAGRPVQGNNTGEEARIMQRTQDRLAKEFNVSSRTIHRDREYSEGIDKLTPELKQAVLAGKQKVSKELIRMIGRTGQSNDHLLALPELLSCEITAPSPENVSNEANHKVDKLLARIRNMADALEFMAPNFADSCTRLTGLLEEAKELKNRK